MANTTLTTLPIELLYSIGHFCTTVELCALLLVNRHFNEAFTPPLYATVHINDYMTTQRCLRTLSRDPSVISYGRDLPSLVRSFKVDLYRRDMSAGPKAKLARRLSRALGRMTNLRHFASNNGFLCSPKIFAAMLHAAAPTLYSLELTPEEQACWADGSDPSFFDNIRPVFPELSSVTFFTWNGTPSYWLDIYKRILTDHSARLREVKVECDLRLDLPKVFRNGSAWSTLVELTLGVYDLVPLSLLPAAPNVRKLVILRRRVWNPYGEDASEPMTAVPLDTDTFPLLDTLECPHELLPLFLPKDTPTQRPIRTVRLDRASYDEDRLEGYYSPGSVPAEWDDVTTVLSDCLLRSAGPVTDLSFFVNSMDASRCWDKVPDYLSKVERLVILSYYQDLQNQDSIGDWDETLFAYTPKLQTLLLSDAPSKAQVGPDDDFIPASDKDLQMEWMAKWSKHSDTLKKVAFTDTIVWMKTEDGWSALEKVGRYRWYADWDDSGESESSVVLGHKR
ncbi:hypothetical protein BV20DRAFT_974302 [Pilatotrama ljubarskyi]|nr:hypothetical protein BV20DRAFT_974302 [Pilatotrama ljubarskyi]